MLPVATLYQHDEHASHMSRDDETEYGIDDAADVDGDPADEREPGGDWLVGNEEVGENEASVRRPQQDEEH